VHNNTCVCKITPCGWKLHFTCRNHSSVRVKITLVRIVRITKLHSAGRNHTLAYWSHTLRSQITLVRVWTSHLCVQSKLYIIENNISKHNLKKYIIAALFFLSWGGLNWIVFMSLERYWGGYIINILRFFQKFLAIMIRFKWWSKLFKYIVFFHQHLSYLLRFITKKRLSHRKKRMLIFILQIFRQFPYKIQNLREESATLKRLSNR
jgi:hypothetical protein